MSEEPGTEERFNPWSVVHLVFDHLSAQGLHPVLGDSGDPSEPAGELLRALGITPGDPSWARGQDPEQIQDQLANIRSLFEPVDSETGSEGR
ncbi:hypothetical protein LQ327_05245 [Actinomycetospora endophytica]|uniref:Uncharacterized protein n=1 Tax=Actinomycetospora endophytica TaxID=2291215 RepID=A0ABS8P3G3_9PSEU|nr:hypothetical protein [Actinomycetospora endophytica]MCD2192792.1 hypothetical protein [Actinomycetospora endophytica]